MRKLKELCILFFSMLKIGLFTFGGGYAMIHVLENEFVEKKKRLQSDEFIDLVAIAESTPGPIAINCATYIGYKTQKTLGSVVATLGMVFPSLCIIYLISLFFNQFLSIGWVASAFRGIRACVVFLIFSAGLKMFKKIKKTPFTVAVFTATFLCMTAFCLFSVGFSSIFYILISGCLGLLAYGVRQAKAKSKPEKNSPKKGVEQ